MKNLILAVSLALTTTLVYADVVKKEATPPVQAQKKPDVKKPCKEGQDPEKDKCHEVKKIEKKAPPKKDEKKK